ncbi:hypothetical protein T4B_12277 [Trichinella pseudospiralis]|uniref:Uncharacterized protein n=1 Tax=Trichinella pseudospiralis TaxID=6337 RepID=A0A0V1GI93_TRIPS|nr:hypothetical protein T4B_12277 [Trichinella pseudospiralis]
MQIILLPEAEPGASPRAGDFRKFQIFKNFLKFSLRQRPRRYAPGYASGIFTKFFEFFRILAPGVAPGYASGQIKICICPQDMPLAFYCTIFALRLCENLHM